MPRIATIWNRIRDSLWFVPAVITTAAAGLATVLVRLDVTGSPSPDELWWLFGGGAEGARGVLGAIAGGIITVTGVVFSVTIIALQLASTQFTPRVLRQFMADRSNQIVLGVFIGTFTYTLLVQRTVRNGDDSGGEFVPALATTGAVVLALVAIGFLIFFIDHLARSIQAENIIGRIADDTLKVLDRHGSPDAVDGEPNLPPTDRAALIRAPRAGYIEAIDEEALLAAARKHDAVVRVLAPVGGFVLEDEPIASVWSPATREIEKPLVDALVIAQSRTPHQDVALGLVELVDIAVKALSPGINDPTTAMTAIDRIGEVVLAIARRSPGEFHITRDDDGAVRLVVPRLGFARAVDLGFRQIRHFGASNPVVATRAATVLRSVSERLPSEARGPLLDQLRLLGEDVEREVRSPTDRSRVIDMVNQATRAVAD